jgi:hypothetical protein
MFGIAHWQFAYQYYNSAVAMPYLSAGQMSVPEKKRKSLNVCYIFVFMLIIFSKAINSCTLVFINWSEKDTGKDILEESKFWFWTYFISRYSVGVIQVFVGLVLLVAVYKIRKQLIDFGRGTQIKQTQMIVHALSFILYDLSILVYYVSFYIFTSKATTATPEELKNLYRDSLITWICTAYFSFLSQLCMIWIFLQFRHRSEPDRATRKESWDSD